MKEVDFYGASKDKKYLHQLLQAAKDYNSDMYGAASFYEVSFFYRNKSKSYFLEAERDNNVLKKRRKDYNGDAKSPINGKIAGVFLSIRLFNGTFPTMSPFGNTRVHFPIEALFRESTNLYFTDFYCTTSDNHYVTLVLTPQASSEDVFCQKNILKLDPGNNPFLRLSSTNSYQIRKFSTVKKSKFHVEVLYTENVHLDNLKLKYGPEKVFFFPTEIIGKGHSTPGGLRKNTLCSFCNPPSDPTPYVSQTTMKGTFKSAHRGHTSSNMHQTGSKNEGKLRVVTQNTEGPSARPVQRPSQADVPKHFTIARSSAGLQRITSSYSGDNHLVGSVSKPKPVHMAIRSSNIEAASTCSSERQTDYNNRSTHSQEWPEKKYTPQKKSRKHGCCTII